MARTLSPTPKTKKRASLLRLLGPPRGLAGARPPKASLQDFQEAAKGFSQNSKASSQPTTYDKDEFVLLTTMDPTEFRS